MNQDTDTRRIPYTQIDPKVERYFTVKVGDVAIFQFPVTLDRELVDQLTAQIEPKMGTIPFLIVGPEVNVTILRPEVTPQAFIA